MADAIKCKHCGTMLSGPGGGAAPRTGPGVSATGETVGAWWNAAGPLGPGTTVREYRIEAILGQGGMGEVYRAVHVQTHQQVAMKVISPELIRDQQVRNRFLEEARVMAGLDHRNIVRLLTFFEEGGRLFLVMDFIEGRDLESLLRERVLAQEEANGILRQVLEGLAYAHSRPQPVVHRDIKPGNILLGADGRAVITDFGIAKAIGREKMTRAGAVIGTFEYLSPEQVQGEEVGPASDLYAVGVMFFQMLTGIVPYPQKTDTGLEVMRAHLEAPVPPLDEFREGLPPACQAFLERAMAKRPEARFSGAAEMANALGGEALSPPAVSQPMALDDSPPHLPPASQRTGLWLGIAFAVVGIVAVLAVGAGAGWFSAKGGDAIEDGVTVKKARKEREAAREREDSEAASETLRAAQAQAAEEVARARVAEQEAARVRAVRQAEADRHAREEAERQRVAEEKRRLEAERAAQGGVVTARSSRPGVGVYLDGVSIGSTPVTRPQISPGGHRLEWRVNGHAACNRTIQVVGGTEQSFDCEAPKFIYRARLGDRDHHNSKGVLLKSADGIIRQDRAWVHRYSKMDPEDELDPVFDGIKMRGQMESMLARALSSEDKRRILNSEPLIEVWIWDHSLDVRFVD